MQYQGHILMKMYSYSIINFMRNSNAYMMYVHINNGDTSGYSYQLTS